MARMIFGNIERIEQRHPGFCRQLDAMFEASISQRRIAAAIHALYGETICPESIGKFKKADWDVRRALNQAPKAARAGGLQL